MRRRDYELIAQGLKSARPERTVKSGDPYLAWRQAVECVGSVLELDNAGFDYQLWLHNCGVEAT